MAQCVICKAFLPPGFTKLIPGTKFYKCKFCEQGKDKIMSMSTIHGGIQWDIKKQIVYDYKIFLDNLAKNKDARHNIIKDIKQD